MYGVKDTLRKKSNGIEMLAYMQVLNGFSKKLDRFGDQAFLAIISLTILYGAAIGFLSVEDAVVYFHRANYTDFPAFFYYAGYSTPIAQAVAYLVANFSPPVQVFIYIGVSGATFFLLCQLLQSISKNSWLVMGLCCILLLSYPVYFVATLTYNFWNWLVIAGLLPFNASLHERRLGAAEGGLAVVASMSSPFTVFMAPLWLLHCMRYKENIGGWLGLAASLLSPLLLVDFSSNRSVGFLSLGSWEERLFMIFEQPQRLLPAVGPESFLIILQLGVFVMLLICMLAVFYYALFSKAGFRYDWAALSAAAIAPYWLAMVTLPAESIPLAVRYFYPAIIVGMLICSKIAPRFLWRSAQVAIILLFVFLPMKIIFFNMSKLNVIQEWSILMADKAGILHRPPDWHVGLHYNLNYDEASCTLMAAKEDYDFRIFCRDDAQILAKSSHSR